MPENRRRFSRILFHTDARFVLPEGEFPVEVLDLSLKGALIHPRSDFFAPVGTNAILKLELSEGAAIEMEATIAHRQGEHYGLACRNIDLDSVTHLRRLVELNIGDEEILDRELSALSRLDI